MVKRAAAVLGAFLAALALVGVARADGEAGVVIDYGGTVRTECVAFEGDSISGEELLRLAGATFDQFGGGARALCSLDGVGCSDSSSFESCFCECKSGSGACTYWAFFIQRYGGSWQYSAVGFNLAVVRDGDLHGWKWGSGSMQSAPPPSGTTFENVCGHSPNGGQPPTPTPTNTPPPPTATPTRAATATPTGTAPGASASPSAASPSPAVATPTATPPAATVTSSPSNTPSAGATRQTPAPVTVTMMPPGTGDSSDEDGGTPIAAWAGFGAVALLLAGGIAFATMRRRADGD
jgi:hypothetical protein